MPPRAPLPISASWLTLLAATTLGAASFGHVRARISGAVGDGAGGSYRLVVHSYGPKALDARGLPVKHARPKGSLQRAITAEELEQGVSVSLLEVDEASTEPAMLVAWVERGEPTLEFDARTARPAANAAVGVGRVDHGRSRAEVVLARL